MVSLGGYPFCCIAFCGYLESDHDSDSTRLKVETNESCMVSSEPDYDGCGVHDHHSHYYWNGHDYVCGCGISSSRMVYCNLPNDVRLCAKRSWPRCSRTVYRL